MPVIRCTTPDGEEAEGPMIRQGKDRKELLVWRQRGNAEAAARELVSKSGGKSQVRLVKRKDIIKECRTFSAWGAKVVAVIFE